MREDPQPNKDPAQKTFFGDNFVRQRGDVDGFGALNLYSITSYEKGQDVHLQATPSQAEMAFQQFKARKEALAANTKQDVVAKYGNAAEAPSEELLALKVRREGRVRASGCLALGVGCGGAWHGCLPCPASTRAPPPALTTAPLPRPPRHMSSTTQRDG